MANSGPVFKNEPGHRNVFQADLDSAYGIILAVSVFQSVWIFESASSQCWVITWSEGMRCHWVHSKKLCPMLHQKEALICWLQGFVVSCTISNGELHQKMVKCFDKSTKIWCSLGQLFVASKSVLLFGATWDEIF